MSSHVNKIALKDFPPKKLFFLVPVNLSIKGQMVSIGKNSPGEAYYH